MKRNYQFSHFIITRFNIKNKGWEKDKNLNEVNNDDWLKHRILIFEKYCLPSINNQTEKDFLWLVYFDIDASDYLKEKITYWGSICSNFKALYVNDYDSFIDYEISDTILKYRDVNKNYIVTTRIDNDDAFHKNAVEIIQKNFKPSPIAIIDLEKGYILSLESNLLFKKSFKSNPFISLIEDISSGDKILSVMKEGHPAWINKVPFITVKDNPLWVQIIHEKNVSNSIKGTIMLRKSVLKEFGIELQYDKYFLYSLKCKVQKNIMLLKHLVKMTLLPIWRLLPFNFRDFIAKRNERKKQNKYLESLIKRIIRYYNDNKEECDAEKKEIIDFIKTNKNFIFPYSFTIDYYKSDIEVLNDNIAKLPYVFFENKRLYFPENWKTDKIKGYFRRLLIEQDERSPHKYLSMDFNITSKDIIVDIGAADGNFSLSVIETVGKAYIIESEEEWIKPLEYTFYPWKEKVEIVKMFVSNIDNDNKISIDNYFKDKKVTFFKIDVEGNEFEIIDGAKQKMQNAKDLKFALCVYHHQEDAMFFKDYFESKGFSTEFSKGYMIYLPDKNQKPPFLRKGVLRANKI